MRLMFSLFLLPLVLFFQASPAFAKCCRLGCCKCGCVAISADQAKAKAELLANDLDKVLHQHKIAGRISSFEIVTTDDPDGQAASKAIAQRKYICTGSGAALTCKEAAVVK